MSIEEQTAKSVDSTIVVDGELPIPENGLIYFGADWCAPCKVVKPFIKEIKENRENIIEIDVDDNYLMAQYFDIKSVPTFVSIKNGKEYERKIGTLQKENLLEMLKKIKEE